MVFARCFSKELFVLKCSFLSLKIIIFQLIFLLIYTIIVKLYLLIIFKLWLVFLTITFYNINNITLLKKLKDIVSLIESSGEADIFFILFQEIREVQMQCFPNFQTSEDANFEFDFKTDALAATNEIWHSTHWKTNRKTMVIFK